MRSAVVALALASVGFASEASAQLGPQTYFDPGAVVSLGSRDGQLDWGAGAEASVHRYPTGASLLAYGAFLQLQLFGDGSFRVALGVQGGAWVGAELGLALRTGTAHDAFSFTPHVGLYASAGVASVGARWNPTLGARRNTSPFAAVFTLKYPVPLRRTCVWLCRD